MKQAGFEEVPRLAGTTVPVSRSAQRWAREPRPYAPSRTHCTGRTGSSAPTTLFVGADAYIGPTGYFPHSRQGTRALPYKIAWCRAAPLVTDAGRCGHRPLRYSIGKRCVGVGLPDDPPGLVPHPLAKKPVIARAQGARGNPFPRPLAPAPGDNFSLSIFYSSQGSCLASYGITSFLLCQYLIYKFLVIIG